MVIAEMLSPADVAERILAASSAGGVVDLPPNARIALSEPLALQPNVRFVHTGATFVLTPDFRGNAVLDTGGHDAGVVQVSDLTIDLSAVQDQDVIGLWLQRVRAGSYVERVTIKKATRSGICLGSVAGFSDGVRIQGCEITECGRLYTERGLTDPDFMGISVVNAIDVDLSHNRIIDCPIAINCEQHPGVDDRLWNIQIQSNRIRTSTSYPTCWGIAVQGQPGREARLVTARGNTLWGPAAVGAPFFWQHADRPPDQGNDITYG